MVALASAISLSVSPARRAQLEAELAGVAGGVRWVLNTSINEAAVSGRALMVDELKQTINLPVSTIRDRVTIPTRAHADKPEAIIRIDYKPVRLQEFKGAGTGKTVRPVTTIKGAAPVTQSHGFRATMKNGHRSVFRRSKLTSLSAVSSREVHAANPKRDFSNYEVQQELDFIQRFNASSKKRHGYHIAGGRATNQRFRRQAASGYASRLPIEDVFGPSVVTAMDKTPGLEERVTDRILEQLGKRVESKTDYLIQTGKLPGRTS